MEENIVIATDALIRKDKYSLMPFLRPTCLRQTLISTLLLVCTLLTSCQLRAGYSANRTLPSDGWDQTECVEFQIDSLTEAGTYLLRLRLSSMTARAYTLQSLTLSVEEVWNGQTPQEYIVTIPISDSDGTPRQSGISINRYTHPLHQITLPQASKGTIRIRHKMRSPVVEGIAGVGLDLIPVHP